MFNENGAPGISLESHLSSQLYLPGGIGCVIDYPEVRVVNRGVRRAEDRMIERIFSFESEFKIHPFMQLRQGKVFLHRHVGVEGCRRPNYSRGSGSISKCVNGRQLEDSGIGKVVVDPRGVGPLAADWSTDYVGSLRAIGR